MSTQTQLEIMLRVVAEQARRELGQAKGDVQALTGAARDLGAQAGQGRDGLAVLGAGAAGAGKSLAEASVAALDASASMSNMMAAAGRGATSLAGVQNAVSGLTTNISAQVNEMLAAQRETAAWQSELDQLRARFNPLFAASKQYETTLREIAEAEKLGALSANEANAARDRAAQVLTVLPGQIRAVGASSSATSAYVANLGYQFNDIGMMLAAGQSPFMLMMQQGPQVTQVFDQMRTSGMSIGAALKSSLVGLVNPMNLATMAVIGFGAAVVQWFMDAGEKAKTLDERMSDLSRSTSDMGRALSEAKRSLLDLSAEFGTGAVAAREMNMALLDLAKIEAFDKVMEAAEGIGEKFRDLTYLVDQYNEATKNAGGAMRDDWLAIAQTSIRQIQAEYGLTIVQATQVARALGKIGDTDNVDGVVQGARELTSVLNSARDASGKVPEGLRDAARESAKTAIEALRLKGYTEQAAQVAKALSEGKVAEPFTSAADEAKRLADETMRALKTSRDWRLASVPGAGLRSLDDERGSQRDTIADIRDARTETAATGREILRTQAESLGQLQLEASLIGQSEETRRRTLALYEAELQIRERGISPSSGLAADIRQNAVAIKEFEAQIDRVKDGWKAVERAGEDAIDGVFDALNQGDIGGAFESLASEIGSMFEDLAIKNPLKNAILGTNYATLGDVGGLQGIWDRFTGKGPQVDPSQAAAAAMRTVANMNVTAATVIIGGAGVTSLAGGIGAGGGLGGLQGSADVQKQVWQFFAGKGLKPHQIAGVMGNISQESGFNPLAVGDAGQAYGLFQHNDRKGALFGAIGGKQNLGNVQAQLDFAWRELMTSENGAYQRLMASKNVSEATGAFAGFERPKGWSVANPMGSDGWSTRLGAAEQAMTKFGTTTTLATGQLGTMGSGFDKFGQALGGAMQGAGGGGGFWGTLFSGLMSGLGIPGFAGGGPTGGSNPTKVAGVVHEAEYVFDAASVRRIGMENLEAIRRGRMPGYATGGYVTGPSTIVPADLTRRILSGGAPSASMTQIDARPVINITNTSSVPVQGDVQETTDSRGQRRFELVMADAVASGLTAGGGRARRTMRDYYGVTPVGIAR